MAIATLPTLPSKGKAGEGGSKLELPSSAVVKNSLMMLQQRLVTEKLLSAQADLPSRRGRSVIPGRLGLGEWSAKLAPEGRPLGAETERGG